MTLVELDALEVFDVAHNDLSGKIQIEGQYTVLHSF